MTRTRSKDEEHDTPLVTMDQIKILLEELQRDFSKVLSSTSSKPTSNYFCDVKCYKCNDNGHYAHDGPNKRVMFISNNGTLTFDSENDDLDATNDVSDYDDEEEIEEVLEPHINRENFLQSYCLVVRQSFNIQVRDNSDEVQMINIFELRYLV
ncbi:hypothetical protein PVK06_012251 [Gossypium arboreum]|uniref:Uncharacterized protein n=1 Tax=Gossypium arboreum TaxID=29729 RepID=A0ABR0QB90_GOSAR|nr:hypothetical protein PVK06_012251 [Gossypium arboreum]